MAQEYNKTFGVFKPVGHVVISFPTADKARETARELGKMDVQGDAVRFLTDREMIAQIDGDLENASPLAGVGQELNLIKSHQALAEEGFHFLVVRAEDDEQAAAIADCAKAHGGERAQHYGHFVIEELISHPTDMPQRRESPETGLDAQTPSGEETERADIRPPEETKK